MTIPEIASAQRRAFQTGVHRSYQNRRNHLMALRNAVRKHEAEIAAALFSDLHKSSYESYLTETGLVLNEISFALRHLRSWMKPVRAQTPVTNAIGSSKIYAEPYGCVLIIAPWNYPVYLSLTPLVAAIAAGNCCILKPSEISSATSSALKKIIDDAFDPDFVACIEGGIEASHELLNQKFDYIFFTGNSVTGKIVAASAAKNLTPYALELGGKSPCIVDEKIHLETTAKRIAWGKWLNAGQTCVAPDYLFVHKHVKDRLIRAIQKYTQQFFGTDALSSGEFPHIVNEKHFRRLASMLNDGKIIFGGKGDATTLCIEPTLIENPSWNDSIMQQEIFGPILPIIEFENIDEVIAKIKEQPKPLSLYIFSTDKKFQNKIINECPSGGCMINDVAEHLSNPHLPFGGVGESGTGSYHGKFGFDTFSHHKAVMKKSMLFALPLRYPPYAKRPLWFVKWFLR